MPITEHDPAPTSPPARKGLTRISYTHDAMIDLILADPSVRPAELAEVFGYSQRWVGHVLSSDAFQARLAARKSALIDPQISRSLNERIRGVTVQAIDVISQKLEAEQSASFALEALGVAVKGLQR